jgi:pimeloyl-ACP methyl ester carboxylesterase
VSLSAKASAVLDVTELQTANSISDPAYKDAVQRIQFLNVPVPENVLTSGMASVSYIHWKSEKPTRTLPILLIPGFDSSLLEFRRLGPQLALEGIEVYAVDLLGFGFTQFENIQDVSANAKVTTLSNFWKALHAATTEDDISYSRNFVVAGASLGGAAAIELAAIATRSINNPVKGMVCIDAQGFVDGVGPMANLPGPCLI